MKTPCPCGKPIEYAACCGKHHSGINAPDPEALMRSRYSAYALGLEAYLLQTWHPSTRPAKLGLDEEPRPKWLGLEVKAVGRDSVEFVARYKIGGKAHRLHETSRFLCEEGEWRYLDGK